MAAPGRKLSGWDDPTRVVPLANMTMAVAAADLKRGIADR
jgi:hypothetical protein